MRDGARRGRTGRWPARGIRLGVGLLVAGVVLILTAGAGWFGRHEGPGAVTSVPRPARVVHERRAALRRAAAGVRAPETSQILFGDLHVHTTISLDAFLFSLPMMTGDGTHPQADACDFARFCSALDFWSINDHAESISPRAWRETIRSIRNCNAVSGTGGTPDTVAFLGWEWTQSGATAETHWGHRNVVLAGTEDADVPARPIGAYSPGGWMGPFARGVFAWGGMNRRYHDFARWLAERSGIRRCSPATDAIDPPEDCIEIAETPGELQRRLRSGGYDALVIPHGTTWGYYTPQDATWDKQLDATEHDPGLQRLLEIYSGHGNAESYRAWRPVERDAEGRPTCPLPTPAYLPVCWQAGEIVRGRCRAEGGDEATCERRAEIARRHAVAAGDSAELTVPGTRAEEWLDAGQCRDCEQPAFDHRPGGSAQYIMALGRVGEGRSVRRFRFGFVGSSDTHFARAGSGYKEVHRIGMTDSPVASLAGVLAEPFAPERARDAGASVAIDRRTRDPGSTLPTERAASYFLTGGLVAVHARGRDRAAIWSALRRREVYATTGPRILLWFDLLSPPGDPAGVVPMGGEVRMHGAPSFRVRAVGSFEQKPGCPDHVIRALGAERTRSLCLDECYHPSDRRRPITRIVVVRILPRVRDDEPIADLIRDPWRRIECAPDPAGCVATFRDDELPALGRDAVYYVRAYEAPTAGINAAGLRCRREGDDPCVAVDPCWGRPGDDCLAPYEPRAFSSPIFVDVE